MLKVERSEIPNKSDTPIFDYCRMLMDSGVEPQTRLVVTRDGREDVYVRSIEEGSRLTVNGVYFETYRKHH